MNAGLCWSRSAISAIEEFFDLPVIAGREETWRARRLPREWADTRLAELVISEVASSDEAVPDVFPLLPRDDDGSSVGPRGLMLD